MDTLVLCFIVILALIVLVSVGEIVSGTLMSFTLSLVLARRKELPHAFTRLVVLKLGIYISGLVLGPSILMFLIFADSHGGLNRSYSLIVMLFFVWPLALFTRRFKSIVRFEMRQSHRRARSKEDAVTRHT